MYGRVEFHQIFALLQLFVINTRQSGYKGLVLSLTGLVNKTIILPQVHEDTFPHCRYSSQLLRAATLLANLKLVRPSWLWR